MKSIVTVEDRVNKILSRRLKVTYFVFGAILLVQTAMFFGVKTSADAEFIDQADKVIRTKGIVVVDEQGRDRILIGSPIPASKYRVRTDIERYRKEIAPSVAIDMEKYMEWYKNYKHSSDGIVVMDENGVDRVLLGDKLADPNVGKRIFEPAGMLVNDNKGMELLGAGVGTKDGKTVHAAFGLDNPKNGREGLHLVSAYDGTKGIIIGGEKGKLMLGTSEKDGKLFKNKEPFVGFKLFDFKDNLLWEQPMLKETK